MTTTQTNLGNYTAHVRRQHDLLSPDDASHELQMMRNMAVAPPAIFAAQAEVRKSNVTVLMSGNAADLVSEHLSLIWAHDVDDSDKALYFGAMLG